MDRKGEGAHVFLSPHPDDIAFSAFASLAATPTPDPRFIVTVFSRSCWTYGDAIDPTNPLAVSAGRLEEEMRYAWEHRAGVIPLGFCDTSLRGFPSGAECLGKSRSDPIYPGIKSELRHILSSVRPDSVCYVPLGVFRHVDHLIVRDAALSARDRRQTVIFYEDLPYAEGYTEAEVHDYASSVEGCPQLSPQLLDLTSSWPEKLRAIQMYPSQLEPDTIAWIERHARRVAPPGLMAERVWVADLETAHSVRTFFSDFPQTPFCAERRGKAE